MLRITEHSSDHPEDSFKVILLNISNLSKGRAFSLHGTVVALLGIAALVGSCYYDNEEDLYELWNAQNNCDTIDVSFSEDIQPIMASHCATPGCHVPGGSGPGIFQTYEQISSVAGGIRFRAVEVGDMPPSGPLSPCNQNLILAWIRAGAPDN